MKCLKQMLCLVTVTLTASTHAATWLTDFAAAKAQAAQENKTILVNFTGSDWCGWCIRLRNEVFSQPEFDAYASKNLVLLEIDFPKRKLPAAQQRANAKIADSFRIGGYPTILLLNSQGAEIKRTGYQPGGAKSYVQHLAKLTGVAADSGPAVAARPQRTETAPAKEVPLFAGAPTAPPPRYSDLVLKSISGTKTRRFALVNNQTLAAGETARVKLHDGDVNVRCIEIRDASVIVAVDGQPGQREIKLRTIQ